VSDPLGMLFGMRGTVSNADRAVWLLLGRQADLITRTQALACDMSVAEIRSKLRVGGQWKAVLPGIYLAHTGSLTVGQREMAAALYAGHDCVITGAAALRRCGVRVQLDDVVDVLIPASAARQSRSFVRIHRTGRMPGRPWVCDGLRWAPAARAVADAARSETDLRAVRALVAGAVQQGKCTVEQLVIELRAGPKQGSAALRAALDEVIEGVASVIEGDARALIKTSGLPEPLYNPKLYVGEEFLAQPDLWWPDAGVAGEMDSREWHLSPASWEKTLARHGRMSAHGIIVLHWTHRRIRMAPAEVIAQLRSALQAGRQRPPLAIRTVPGRRN
jgi:hypothetical protein